MSTLIESIKRTNKNIKFVLPLFLFYALIGVILFVTLIPLLQSGGTKDGLGLMILFGVIFAIACYAVTIGALGMAIDIAKHEKTSFRAFIHNIKKYILPILGASLLIGIASQVLNMAFIGLMELFLGASVVDVLSSIFSFVLSILFTMAPIILIFDQTGIIDSIKKSVKVAFPAFIRYVLPSLVIMIGAALLGLVAFLIHPMFGIIFIALLVGYFTFVFNVLFALIYAQIKEKYIS